MNIAISALGADLESQVDPRFGRAQYFIIVDPETMEFEAINNSSLDAMHGAGIQSGQLMSSKGVTAVITGSVGPNAHQTLTAAGIQIFQAGAATVALAIDAYKKGQLQPITQIGPSHAGTGGGMGMGRGMGMGTGVITPPPPSTVQSKAQKIQELKMQAETLSGQLEDIKTKIDELAKDKS